MSIVNLTRVFCHINTVFEIVIQCLFLESYYMHIMKIAFTGGNEPHLVVLLNAN